MLRTSMGVERDGIGFVHRCGLGKVVVALEVILGLVLRAATSIVVNGAKAGGVGNESPIPDDSTLDGVAVLKQGVCSPAGGSGESLIPSEY